MLADVDIGKIIQNLDSKKVQHSVSIRIVKICSNYICIPFEMNFKQTLLTSVFLS